MGEEADSERRKFWVVICAMLLLSVTHLVPLCFVTQKDLFEKEKGSQPSEYRRGEPRAHSGQRAKMGSRLTFWGLWGNPCLHLFRLQKLPTVRAPAPSRFRASRGSSGPHAALSLVPAAGTGPAWASTSS